MDRAVRGRGGQRLVRPLIAATFIAGPSDARVMRGGRGFAPAASYGQADRHRGRDLARHRESHSQAAWPQPAFRARARRAGPPLRARRYRRDRPHRRSLAGSIASAAASPATAPAIGAPSPTVAAYVRAIVLACTQSLMGWPAPPSGAVRSPVVQEEGMDITVLGVDLGKNVCSVVGLDASGAVVVRREGKTGDVDCAGGEASSMRCRDGGLLWRPSSRLRVRGSRPRRLADVAGICPALRQGAEERRSRRRGRRGSSDAASERDTPLGRWAKALLGRAHHNVAVVAFANKLARIAWAVLRHGERFAAKGMPAAS